MKNTVSLTVIIPTMNRPDTLERTLAGYIKGSAVPDQIVIVDQTQTETTRQKVEKLTKQYGGEYIYQEEPSLTAARNKGLSAARNDIVVCSDDDVDVYEDTLINTYTTMQREEIALIAGLDDNANASQTNIGYLLGTKSYRKRKIGHVTKSVLGRYPDTVTGETETEWAMGYFFVIRKTLCDQWDIRWDERLVSYAYAEDLDFSWRYCNKAHSSGLKCVLSEQIRVRHMVSKEYRTPSAKSTYMYVVHRRYIAQKNKCGLGIAMSWCDLWRLIERIIKREEPLVFFQAICASKKLEKQDFIGMEDLIRSIM